MAKKDTDTTEQTTKGTATTEKAKTPSIGVQAKNLISIAVTSIRDKFAALLKEDENWTISDIIDEGIWDEMTTLAAKIAEQSRNVPLVTRLATCNANIDAEYEKAAADLKYFRSAEFQAESTRLINLRTRLEKEIAKEAEAKENNPDAPATENVTPAAA